MRDGHLINRWQRGGLGMFIGGGAGALKPSDFMRQLERICDKDERILDPFAGSGTALVAADIEGYCWTGIEMASHYFDVANGKPGTS